MSDPRVCAVCGRQWPVITLATLCTHKPPPEKLY